MAKSFFYASERLLAQLDNALQRVTKNWVRLQPSEAFFSLGRGGSRPVVR